MSEKCTESRAEERSEMARMGYVKPGSKSGGKERKAKPRAEEKRMAARGGE